MTVNSVNKKSRSKHNFNRFMYGKNLFIMEILDDIGMKSWLTQSPKYTTFRINKLKTFDIRVLQDFLLAVSYNGYFRCRCVNDIYVHKKH